MKARGGNSHGEAPYFDAVRDKIVERAPPARRPSARALPSRSNSCLAVKVTARFICCLVQVAVIMLSLGVAGPLRQLFRIARIAHNDRSCAPSPLCRSMRILLPFFSQPAGKNQKEPRPAHDSAVPSSSPWSHCHDQPGFYTSPVSAGENPQGGKAKSFDAVRDGKTEQAPPARRSSARTLPIRSNSCMAVRLTGRFIC